jgi:uncharacterized membrane protein
MLAFLAVDGLSIAFGGTLLALVPLRYVQVVSGIVFVAFGVFPYSGKAKPTTLPSNRKEAQSP